MAPVKGTWAEIDGEFVQCALECVGDESSGERFSWPDFKALDDWRLQRPPTCWTQRRLVVSSLVQRFLQTEAQYQPAVLQSAHQHFVNGRLAGWCIGYYYEADIDDEC